MKLLSLLLVAILSSIAVALPRASSTVKEASTTATAQCWKGTNFPATANWASFDDIFSQSTNNMLFGGDTDGEIAGIRNAITYWSSQSGVDDRFILAVMMRESSGVTTTPCGDNGASCGLMQVMGPNVPSCYNMPHPCPNSTISTMIQCGTAGCNPPGTGGSYLSDCLSRYGQLVGAAARCYNTGSVPNPNNWTDIENASGKSYGIQSYVQDTANILLGVGSQTWTQLDQSCGF